VRYMLSVDHRPAITAPVWRAALAVVLAWSMVLLLDTNAFALPQGDRAPARTVPASPAGPDGQSPDFGPAGRASADLAVTGWGDPAGYHVDVAREAGDFTWQEIALLHPAGLDDQSWIGYQCVSGDGRFAAVTILPASAVNLSAARDHGALAYSVDLTSGKVRPLVAAVGLKYHTPGCGTGTTAVFTANPDPGETSTVVVTADLATGAVTGRTTVAGQLTSAVPVGKTVVGVMGRQLMRIAAGGGKPERVWTAPGSAYELRPAADGGVDFVSLDQSGRTASAWHVLNHVATKLAGGPPQRLHLFQGRSGRSVLTGSAEIERGAQVSPVDDHGLAHGAQFSSLDGDALYGAQSNRSSMSNAVLATRTHRVLDRRNAGSGAASTRSLPATTSTGAAVRGPKVAGPAPLVAQTPKCGVPRLTANRQSLQPHPTQVDWAVQMAEQNLLTGSLGRPAGYANMGLAAYAANSDFPKIPLSHPAGDTWDSVPRSVMEAILAQESNWNQASWHALPGIAGDPLIASYYGVVNSINTIDYANADCGYGIAQVTSGMAASETSITPNGKAKVAVDYEENIAAGLQILQQKWNQLYAAGIIANDGNPRYLENWYFAVWAYNSGIQPTAQFGNTSGCTPSPTCTGPDGTWGLGWSNNPRNPDYPPARPPFLQSTYADAAHPADWPYQERIMGWMGSPLLRLGSPAYDSPDYQGGSTWLHIPPVGTFCSPVNRCDNADPNGQFCTLADFECWWHGPATWVTCSTSCATSSYAVGAGSTEPPVDDPHPPTCSLDTNAVNDSGNGAPILVDDQPSPVNLVGCGPSNWSTNGTFTYSYGVDADGNPTGAIDTHQLGAGFGGHILFSHTEDGTDPRVVNTGRWMPNLPTTQYYKIKIHIPATGASATDVVYSIFPGGGASPWKVRVNQHWESEQWVTIGTFGMQNGGYLELSNTSSDAAYADANSSDFDIAYDAVAFIPMGGNPGIPIGGPPTVTDAPKGSNPAWVQCGCARRTAGDPVDTSTGYFGDSFTDLSTPGRGMSLTFTRTYLSALADPAGPNAAAAINGPFGFGWTFSYGSTAATDATTGNVTITQEDGSRVSFVNSSGTYRAALPRYAATLTRSGSTYTYTRRSDQLFTFDVATGRLLAVTDRAGAKASPPSATTLAYDTAGHLSTISDPAGRRYTLTWTGNHITKLADTAGRTVTYGYDAAGNLTDVFGVGTTRSPSLLNDDHTVFGYTTAHLLNSMREPVAFGSTATPTPVVSMSYDSVERVTSQTDQLGHTTGFVYGPNTAANLVAGQTQVTDPAGHKTVHTYQNGLLVTETLAAGTADAGTWTYTYDPASLGVASLTDPDGNRQTFTYDDHGNQVSVSDARGYTTSSTFDNSDNLTSTIDPTGLQTVFGYDESGHVPAGGSGYGVLTSTTQRQLGQSAEVHDGNPPASSVRTTTFYHDDAAHPADLSRVVTARGNTTTYTYDSAGDITSVKDGENNTTRFGYDLARGLVTSSVSARGVAAGVAPGCVPPAMGCTTYAYDAWTNVVKITDALGHTSQAVYDADGNQTSATDGNNRKTTYNYDLADRPTTETRPDASILTTHYNADNTLADTVNGANQKTSYGYDARGRRSSRTDPDGRVTKWKYDAASRLLSITDPANRVTSYGYDPAGRTRTIAYSDGTTPAVTDMKYDPNGLVLSTVDGPGRRTWTYNAFGEVTAETAATGSVVGYDYDADGNVTAIKYPSAPVAVVRTFDRDDRLVTVKDWNSRTTTFGYDVDGNHVTSIYPNGTSITTAFDGVGYETATSLKAGTTTLASLTSPRDPAGQVGAETLSGLPGNPQTFGYTGLEQLKSTTSGSTTTSYTYNAADEPTTLGPVTQTFEPAGQLCWTTTGTPPASPACASPPTGSTTYAYDPEGDRTTAATGTATTTYTYDQAHRLTQFTKSGTTTRYAYDGAGRRTSKTAGGVTFNYVWDVAGRILSDGIASYLYGPDGTPFEQVGGATSVWYFADQLGSTRALTDAGGTIVAGYTYTPWGSISSHTGSANTPMLYSGQYTDAESGLIYLRARYYDPATAQFLTVDPMLDVTRSPYGYVENNPTNNTDPSGMCGLKCGLLVAAATFTVACIVAAPCGAIEGGVLVTAEGFSLLGATVTVTAAAGDAAAVASVTGLAAMAASGSGGADGECPPEVSQGWGRGSFPTPEDSFWYHYNKHVVEQGLNITPEQYAQDAADWAASNPARGSNASRAFGDEGVGVRYQTPGGGKGGILSPKGPDGIRRIVSFWYD
jgi:RHS repeat-associated protein